MKLLQRFRKQTSREDVEAQAAQELDAAMAKPVDIPAMTPAPGLPGDDLNGSTGAGETPGAADAAAQGENGEPVGPGSDLPRRRPATARKTGARKPAAATSTAASKAGAKTGAGKAKPAGGGKSPVRKPAAKKATASSAGGTVKKRASASGAGGTAERASSARQPAAKKR